MTDFAALLRILFHGQGINVRHIAMKSMTSAPLAAVALAGGLGLATGALAGPGHWTLTGPDGGQVSEVVIDATQPDRAVAMGRGGIFRTLTGGATWERHQGGLDYTFNQALRASTHSSRIYAMPHSRQVFRGSADGPWQTTNFAPPPGEWTVDLAIRQDNDDHLLIAMSNNLLFLSHDAGNSFALLPGTGIPADGQVVRAAYVSATRLFLAFRHDTSPYTTDLLRSEDGGATWSTAAQISETYAYTSPQVFPSRTAADRLYVVDGLSMQRSDDGGATLIACGALPGSDAPTTATVAPHDGDVIWAGGARGLYRSTDACASWTAHGAGISSDGMRPDAIASIALPASYPTLPRLLVGTFSGGLYRSDDNGLSFTMQSQGFASHNIRALAAHPAQPGHLWTGHGDATNPSGTVWRSVDSAASWQRSNTGLQALHLRGITVDPTTVSLPNGPHLYGVGSSLWTGAPAGYVPDGGIYKSLTGGVSWSTIDTGLPVISPTVGRNIGTVRNAVLDPRSCAAPPVTGPCTAGPLQTVYVTASGRVNWSTGAQIAARVYKSTDAGATWNASENGLPLPETGTCGHQQIAVPMAIDPSSPQTLYLGLSLQSIDPACPPPAVANGIFKSTDGGANWTHASNGLMRLGDATSSHASVLTLALAPSQPQRLYAATWYDDAEGRPVSRIYRSDDGGTNWVERSVGVIGQDVRALLVDPADADVVYAAAAGSGVGRGGVYRSIDGGLTWDSISIGIEGMAVTTLMFDPHDPARLYAGTMSGVAEYTRLPDDDSDGVPGGIEDQAPNQGDGNGDGVPDSEQPHVASLPGMSQARGGTHAWVTVWVEPIDGDGSCQRINNMQVLDPATLPADTARGPDATLYADGVVRLDLPDCQHADMHVRFHGADHADPRFTWRSYGPAHPGDIDSLGWHGFAGATRSAPDTWTLRIQGGEPGDWFGNGEVIRFAGGVGFLDLSLFADGFETPVPVH